MLMLYCRVKKNVYIYTKRSRDKQTELFIIRKGTLIIQLIAAKALPLIKCRHTGSKLRHPLARSIRDHEALSLLFMARETKIHCKIVLFTVFKGQPGPSRP